MIIAVVRCELLRHVCEIISIVCLMFIVLELGSSYAVFNVAISPVFVDF